MDLVRKIFLILLVIASKSAVAQLPPNIGFESGSFNGWETSIGYRDFNSGVITMDSPAPPSNRHVIINDKNLTDNYGGFPMLCPNGSNYSIKLGDDNSQTGQVGPKAGRVQTISKTFKVPSNFSLIFNYAVVLEDNRNAGNAHPAHLQPKFEMRVIDMSNNTVLSCPYFDFTASSTLPGFVTSDRKRDPQSEVIYKDWSTAFINLNNYAGKDIKIEFTTTDCGPGRHFGYAYLDIDEILSLNPISGNIFCSNQNVTTLKGPTGFENYTWYKDNDFTKVGITGQSITVPAVDKDNYALHITPYFNLGCEDTLYTTLQKLPEPFNLVVAPKVYGCPGTGFDLTAASVTAGSSSMKFFSYYQDPLGLVYLSNPGKVSVSGTYYIRGTNAGGCTDIKPVEVIITNPDITVTDPLPVSYPGKVDLSLTHDTPFGVIHKYFSDAAGTIEMDKYIGVTGTYYIKATSGIGCSVIKPVKVVVNPPPPYTIEASNTFTPNGDGVNDLFKIKIEGYISLTQLAIFNRYGQQVFTTRSINDYWTGNKGSSPLPTGTYYWIFDGIDDYYHIKVKKSSSITIIR